MGEENFWGREKIFGGEGGKNFGAGGKIFGEGDKFLRGVGVGNKKIV